MKMNLNKAGKTVAAVECGTVLFCIGYRNFWRLWQPPLQSEWTFSISWQPGWMSAAFTCLHEWPWFAKLYRYFGIRHLFAHQHSRCCISIFSGTCLSVVSCLWIRVGIINIRDVVPFQEPLILMLNTKITPWNTSYMALNIFYTCSSEVMPNTDNPNNRRKLYILNEIIHRDISLRMCPDANMFCGARKRKTAQAIKELFHNRKKFQ